MAAVVTAPSVMLFMLSLRNAFVPLVVIVSRVEEAVSWVESVAAPVPVIASTALPAPSVHSTTS